MSLLRERLNRLAKPHAGGAAQRADSSVPGETQGDELQCDSGLSADSAGVPFPVGPGASSEPESLKSGSVGEWNNQLPERESNNEWADCSAALIDTEFGSFVMRRTTYPLSHLHGRYRLGDLDELAGELQAFIEDGQALDGSETLLFFDTETTGLGHGAGNVPFMLGFGYYDRQSFVIEQLFMRNPAEEFAMLKYLESMMPRFTHLVSYNGRSFDWPILKNRFVMNRLKLDDRRLKHLDFLYASRSLWRHTLPSCRLGKVEEEKLGFTRTDDVPGSLAPTLYFLYLAEKDASVLKGVFEHNEQDILSLAGLSVLFSYRLNGVWDAERMEEEELYRLGLWLDKMGKEDLSERVFESLLERPDRESGRYWNGLAGHYKQKGDWNKAVLLWHRAADELAGQSIASLEPFVELAKYYEHRSKDFVEALRYAEEAQRLAWKRASLQRRDAKLKALSDELRKRIERLRDKQTRLDLLEASGVEPHVVQNEVRSRTKARSDSRSTATQGTMTF